MAMTEILVELGFVRIFLTHCLHHTLTYMQTLPIFIYIFYFTPLNLHSPNDALLLFNSSITNKISLAQI